MTKQATYTIKNFEIHVEDMEETLRYMKTTADSQIASDVFSDDKNFLENLTEILQVGFGIWLGYSDENITCEEKEC